MKVIKKYKSGHMIRKSSTGLLFVYEGRISQSLGFHDMKDAPYFVKYLKS